MKERPILFGAPMVRAILDGIKTQTRRVVKNHPLIDGEFTDEFILLPANHVIDDCPYGQVGDMLYVRETWQHSNYPLGPLDADCHIFYRADYFDDPHGMDGEKSPEGKYRDWKPSIHMPRWASRILLEIVSVRVERLNDISESDAMAEGITRNAFRPDDGFPICDGYMVGKDDGKTSFDVTPQESYKRLWESINGQGSWDANPFVWVVEFKVVKS